MVGHVLRPSVAIVIPAFNEPALGPALQHAPTGAADEIIVAHAGDPVTLDSLRAPDLPVGVRTVQAPRGRALQMNQGAAAASADVLLFLHADTTLSPNAVDELRAAVDAGALWGWFDIRLAGRHPLLRVVERMMNGRARISGIATGDQAIFVRRDVFRLLGGYAPIELMEDIELCARLKWFGRPARLRSTIVTSSRRWETKGVIRTIALMWSLRALYAMGMSPRRLARWYR